MTVFHKKDGATQEGFVPARRAPLIAFVAGVMTLVLVAGWLSRLA